MKKNIDRLKSGAVVFLWLLLIIIFNSKFSYGEEKLHSGRSLMLYGKSTASMGRGGTGVSSFDSENYLLNPATISDVEIFNLNMDYSGFVSPYKYYGLSMFYPTSYGVLAASFTGLSIDEDSDKGFLDIKNAYRFSLGMGKEITRNLSTGFSLLYIHGEDAEEPVKYYGVNAGFIYRFFINQSFGNGFGFYNPRLGASIQEGFSSPSEKDYSDFDQITAGYTFDFYNSSNLKFALYNDISVISYKEFPVKFGIEATINDSIIIRGGGSAPQSYDYGDYTFGVGYKYNSESFHFDINYSLVHYSESEFVHSAGINIKYGELDRTPPLTKLKVNEKYISPNYDGVKDYVKIDVDVTDRSNIKGWKLEILDTDGNIVKEFRAVDRQMVDSLTATKFVSRLFSKKESLVVPENIIWDGTNNRGQVVSDGSYSYSFMAWDERENYSSKKFGNIIVDNSPPKTELTYDYRLFSPNSDGNKDTLDIKLTASGNNNNFASGIFFNEEGEIVKSYMWKGGTIPPVIKWNGGDNKGMDAKDGVYTFLLTVKDKAGNISYSDIKNISLTRAYEVVDITLSQYGFSYKRDKNIILKPYLSSMAGLKNWTMVIEDDDGDAVKSINGTDKIVKEFVWNVKDDENKNLSDGKYYILLKTEFNSGNKPLSFKKELLVDSTPPDVSLDFSPSLFSPDKDGENDMLTIETDAVDSSGIDRWDITIYNQTGYVFKVFRGRGKPAKEIKWDGLSDRNELVESASNYSMVLTARDKNGNSAVSEKVTLPVDVLVVVTDRGLKIRVSNIEFRFDSDKLTGKAFKILDRVGSLLEKYEKYNVVIEGHSDDIGEEEYNLKLSEDRSRSVYNYLLDYGIDEDRLKFRGMGESLPFVKNIGKESRRKNRRVEFLLEKNSN